MFKWRGGQLAQIEDGRFAFANLPHGDYVVTLNLPEGEESPSVTVTVIPNETAIAALVMSTSSVRLKVRVPVGRGRDLQFRDAESDTEIGIAVSGVMVINDVDEWCSIDFVRPGKYRMSLDGDRWSPVVVTESPDEQTIDLR